MLPGTSLRRKPRNDSAVVSGLLVAALYAWLLSGSGAAFELGAAAAVRVPVSQGRHAPVRSRVLPAPPIDPPTCASGEGGDDDSLCLTTIDRSHLHATTQLWLLQCDWQENLAPGLEQQRDVLQSIATWAGQQPAKNSRPMGVFVGGQLEGLVTARYEADTSSLWNIFLGQQAIVVDNIAISPAAPPHSVMLLYAGIMHSMQQLAACHNMRLTFASGSQP